MKIVAVIVTYNRPQLLARALGALRTQSRRPDEVFVIDNNSEGVIADVGFPEAKLFRCTHNLGGAGGFALAMELFLNGDGEALLLCDDDGVASPTMLELLERNLATIPYANAHVIDEANPTSLAFTLRRSYAMTPLAGAITSSQALAERAQDGIVLDLVFPFNGTLLQRRVIERVGIVSPRMFIWGDEVEFTTRVKQAGFPIGTVVGATMTHPRTLAPTRRSWVYGPVVVPNKTRSHIAQRNSGWLDTIRKRQLRGLIGALRQVPRLLSIGEWRSAALLLPYHLDGALNLYRLQPTQADLSKRYAVERQRMLSWLGGIGMPL